MVKDIVLVGGAGASLRDFPTDARHRIGYQLYLVQMGADPDNWKPMATVGPGCREIRVRTSSGAWRVIYAAAIGDAVYVLHCFEKKTQRTAQADIDLAKQRYRQAIEVARQQETP